MGPAGLDTQDADCPGIGRAQWCRRDQDSSCANAPGASGWPMTRFGIYKRVRHLTVGVETTGSAADSRGVSPHVWRHTAGVHLLEAGNDVNVIRGWLGHASLNTTNCYAEIPMRVKTEAMTLCVPSGSDATPWRDDPSLLKWLTGLNDSHSPGRIAAVGSVALLSV